MMQGFKIIVLVLVIKFELSEGYCFYGDEKQCAFQCHCAVASECGNSTSECTSGCAGGPLGHKWRGLGCQIGNIGYHKPAFSNTTHFFFHAPDETFFENALDGIADSAYYDQEHCCIPYNQEGADWWVDFGALHRIFNVTIYGVSDSDFVLRKFHIYVYNTTDAKVLCGSHDPVVYPSVTINCEKPLVGRFVYLTRYGEYSYQIALCEVVVIGHRIIDCSKCPRGLACNDTTGCDECYGSYLPDCLTECEDGSYGVNCAERCGKCESGTTCNKADGLCPKGCEPGYYGKTCVATKYCLYGEEKQCAFQCHCAVASECGNTTSECTSGCANGPLEHNWRGPGCQIGNIGYKKRVFTNDYDRGIYFHEESVDGKYTAGAFNPQTCSVIINEGDPKWWVDLGGLHRIFNVTIYSIDNSNFGLSNIRVYVWNVFDDEVMCGYRNPFIHPSVTINCTTPLVGRFVYVIKFGLTSKHFAPCEVVIIGHKIIDCSQCPIGVTCNDITGCAQCHGSYQPDCWSECEDGLYGINCGERCKCKSGTVCNKINGECPDGCQPGYCGKKCVDSCPINCMNNVCSNEGDCIDGCKPGYVGKKCACPGKCMNELCSVEGDCIEGCKFGYYGTKCLSSNSGKMLLDYRKDAHSSMSQRTKIPYWGAKQRLTVFK